MESTHDDATILQVVQTLLPDEHIRQCVRVPEGVSTMVYRIISAAATFYLRICPDADDDLLAEAAVHQRLAAMGLHVPMVLYATRYHPLLQRSLMITTAIPGRAMASTPPRPHDAIILSAVGRELAHINQVPVQGYGWITHVLPASATSRNR